MNETPASSAGFGVPARRLGGAPEQVLARLRAMAERLHHDPPPPPERQPHRMLAAADIAALIIDSLPAASGPPTGAAALLGMPVIVSEEMKPGEWHLLDAHDVVIKAGFTDQHGQMYMIDLERFSADAAAFLRGRISGEPADDGDPLDAVVEAVEDNMETW